LFLRVWVSTSVWSWTKLQARIEHN
jgi:hypothetical protein